MPYGYSTQNYNNWMVNTVMLRCKDMIYAQ